MLRPDWGTVRGFIDTFRRFLPHRFDSEPIIDADALAEFVATRAAFIAQTSLYGYLKNRMGTRYTQLFQDDVYVASINRAKWQVYAACLSDLTVFSVGYCGGNQRLSDAQCTRFAQMIFFDVVRREFTDDDARDAVDEAQAAFQTRLGFADWATVGKGETAFTQSPGELVKAAPVAEHFKEDDREIVMNSIRFRWKNVREQLRKRADAAAIAGDWLSRDGSDAEG